MVPKNSVAMQVYLGQDGCILTNVFIVQSGPINIKIKWRLSYLWLSRYYVIKIENLIWRLNITIISIIRKLRRCLGRLLVSMSIVKPCIVFIYRRRVTAVNNSRNKRMCCLLFVIKNLLLDEIKKRESKLWLPAIDSGSLGNLTNQHEAMIASYRY